MKKFLVLFVLLLAACAGIPYQDDLGFYVSAQANSPEFPVYLNGKLCQDMEGYLGLCSKRLKSDEALKIKFDAQPYSYKLQLTCSKDTGVDFSVAVEKNQPYEFAIEPAQFSTLKSFICVGEIFPNDRDQPISAKWEVRIKIVDGKYVEREKMYVAEKNGKSYLVLGQHARWTKVYDCLNGECGWSRYKKKTLVRIYDPKQAMAYSESYQMRFNSYGVK